MITLPREILKTVYSEGSRTYPNECCGFLLGTVSEGVKTVTEIRVITNQSQLQEKYHRFVIEADDYLSTEKYARSQGLSIVGVYHSHPDHPCEPSEYDREHALPFYSYLIVSIENRQENGYASWVLKNNRSAFDLEEPNII